VPGQLVVGIRGRLDGRQGGLGLKPYTSEDIIKWLDSVEGEIWSSGQHSQYTPYGPASGTLCKVFWDDDRSKKTCTRMNFSSSTCCWLGETLKGSDIPPEHV
jgi:hypothetical protein